MTKLTQNLIIDFVESGHKCDISAVHPHILIKHPHLLNRKKKVKKH